MRALAVALSGLLLAWAMDAGALRWLAPPLRVGLGFALLVWLPGLGWARAIGARPGWAPSEAGSSEAGSGRAFVAAWATGYGIAWLGLLVLALRALGVPFTALAHAGAVWTAVPWLVSLATAPRHPGHPAELGPGASHATTRSAERAASRPGAPGPMEIACSLAIALAALFAFAHVARHGPPVTYQSDSPDHLGTIRRMLASGDPFPRDAFFRDAGPAGVDPRKGLWHPCVALVCALAHVDPVPTWHALASILAALAVLTAAGFAFRLGGPLAAAAGAWGMLLGYGGGLGAPYLGEAVFATKLADALALATAAALLEDLERRSLRSRLAVALLALGTIFTHVFGAIQFAITFGALGVGFLVRDRAWSTPLRRLTVTSIACALVAAPYLAWRAHGAYAPVNVIHTEPQGLLTLAHGVRIVSVGAVWDWMGPLWLLFPLSLVWWARSVREPAVLYLLTTTLAVGALMFLPPVVALLQPRLGYLLMRLPWLLPVGPAAAFLVARAQAAWSAGRRGRALAPAVLLAIAFAGPLADAAHAIAGGAAPGARTAQANMRRWSDALAWMDRGLPAGSVVLSDPATSYSIPAFTRHWVTCLADQHSSPNDSLALARILDARDALDPYAPWARTAQVVARWGATAIALNGRFPEPPGLDYWSPAPDWYDAARARLDRAPEAFERVYDSARFTVYVVHRDALARLTGGGAPRPFVRARTAREPGLDLGAGLPQLVSFRLAASRAERGDTLTGLIEWRAPRALPPGGYGVAVRFDRALPADVPRSPESLSKLWRKLVERSRHERYRFRADHLPTNGAYGVDRWRPDEVVRDPFRLVVPGDVAAGEYTVRVNMVHQPHYPNMALRDLLSDDDFLNGLAVARLRLKGD
jgi:hypothetical protein